MSGDEELQDRFRRLAGATPREAGMAVERELRLKFRARTQQRKRFWSYAAEGAAAALAVISLFWLVTHGRSAEPPAPVVRQLNFSADFIALPYAQSGVPMEQPVIVRVKIPVSELGRMGVPVGVASRSVNADLLVGEDGVARAVRLVQ